MYLEVNNNQTLLIVNHQEKQQKAEQGTAVPPALAFGMSMTQAPIETSPRPWKWEGWEHQNS